jgi:hypothetical protein
VCKSMAPRRVDRYPGSECAGGCGGYQHYGPLGMFSMCNSVVHYGVDPLSGVGVCGQRWWGSTLCTSRYVPCVCKSVVPRRVDRYPGSECGGGGGGDQHYGPLGMFSVCTVRAWFAAGLTAIRGQSVQAVVVGINIMDL